MNEVFPVLLLVAILTIIVLAFRVFQLTTQMETRARVHYLRWRQEDYEALRQEQADVARAAALTDLALWRSREEANIRADAHRRGQAVIVGKVTEHVAPYLPDFAYNPKDARFIGSPIDLLVFDGLDEGTVRQVVFVEVKTGTGSLTARERQV